MKKVLLVVLIIAANLSASAKVKFNLNFTDPEGVGFKAHENRWMIRDAYYAAGLLGSIIEQNAHINVEIKSNMSISYAQATGEYWYVVDEVIGKKAILKAHHKIINEIELDDGETDAKIEFNTSKFYGKYNLFLGRPRHLLRNTIIHELTHELGFISWKIENYDTEYYNDYDKLLHDGNGQRFLVGEYELTINPKFDISSGLYLCGENIRKMNNGRCAKLHSPAEFKCGSSFSHFDSDECPRCLMQHMEGNNDYFIWSNYELGVMQDLGYKINWDMYSKSLKKFYPSYYTIYINGYNPEEYNTAFKIITSAKFEEKYIASTVIKKEPDDVLSIKMNNENTLVLIDNESKDRLFTFSPKTKNQINELWIGARYFKIKYYNANWAGTKIGIHFTEQDPSQKEENSYANYLWELVLEKK